MKYKYKIQFHEFYLEGESDEDEIDMLRKALNRQDIANISDNKGATLSINFKHVLYFSYLTLEEK